MEFAFRPLAFVLLRAQCQPFQPRHVAVFRHQTRKHLTHVLIALCLCGLALALCGIVPRVPTGVLTGLVLLIALVAAVMKFGFFALPVWLILGAGMIWITLTVWVNRDA
jgi:hypothetical protein